MTDIFEQKERFIQGQTTIAVTAAAVLRLTFIHALSRLSFMKTQAFAIAAKSVSTSVRGIFDER